MKRTFAVLVGIICCGVSFVSADYAVEDRGTWPESWPKELEPLRKQSRTFEGPLQPYLHYQIPFTKREEFEAAWPHILKVKSKGGQLILVKAPYTRLGRINAGVFIHTPPLETDEQTKPGEPTRKISKPSERDTTYIQLIVDGQIVDLNRIRLPADTPIVDQRFDSSDTAAK